MLTTKENTPNISQNKTNLVVFRLNRIDYAITVESIQQIIEMVIIIPVLNTEEWMEGVINYHGASVPVVNLRRHFGMEVEPYRWHTPIILVNISDRRVGLIVDEVLDVLAIPEEQIIDPRAILPPGVPQVSLLKSIVQTDQNITLLLDLAHLFDQAQVYALSAAANALDKKTAHTSGDPARSQKPQTLKPGVVSKRKPKTASKQPEKPSAVEARTGRNTMSAPRPAFQSRSAKDIAPLDLGDMLRFSKLLLERYGLHFSSNRRTELEYGIRHAFASSSCATLDEFYNLLVSARSGSVEMDLLVNAVTVSETHFFRDAAQFNALATTILPEIARRKTSLRTLRIWSAGCASGEEPYSIAMLLRDVLPDIENWSITILATDINTTLLERARVASYGQWAFREDRALAMRMRHFRPVDTRFELSSQIRRMVTFSQLNLMEDRYPSFETNTMMMDLVICRNVTIYFPQEVTRQVVGRFHSSLVNGGWLVVGHSEPSLEIYNQFQPRNFPDTVIYQRDDNAKPNIVPTPLRETGPFVFAPALAAAVPPGRSATEAAPTRPVLIPRVNPQPLSAPSPSAKEEAAQVLAHARELLEFGHDQDALNILDKLVETEPNNPQVYTLLGQVHANRGAWLEAEKNCQRAIEINKLALEAYYTLGLVLQHQARLAEAIDTMKKVVYLERNHVLGHYHLAGLYREQGLLPNAQKSLENALNLLHNAPADEMIAGSGGVTVSRLRDAIIHQQQSLNRI